MTVSVRLVEPHDRGEWVRMRNLLWPGSLIDHEAETRAFFETPDPKLVTLIADVDGHAAGFLELDQRRYAEGCSSPVVFIEGWFVDEPHRGRGLGRALVEAAERWVREAGFAEIASDTEIINQASIAAHQALGVEETERTVAFRKPLG